MAAGLVQSPGPVAVGCEVLAGFNCATLISSEDLTGACASAGGVVNVIAVTAVAVPKKPRRVVFPTGSFDMKRPFPC
jgi:hypothetical protein